MDTLEHNGATYVKVSLLAKRFNYTTDYIGQLCRQGKVEAKLVGRSWFVQENSLLAHGSDRLKVTRPNEILSKINIHSDNGMNENEKKVSVYPQLSKHSHRQLLSAVHPVGIRKTTHRDRIGVTTKYDVDDSDTLPKFNYVKPVIPHVPNLEPIPDEMPVGQKIKIKTESKAVKKLHFSHLPEVSLQGALRVHSLDAVAEYEESEPVTADQVPVSRPRPLTAPVGGVSQVHPSHHAVPPSDMRVPLQHPHLRPLTRETVVLVSTSSHFSFFIPLVMIFSLAIAGGLLSLSSLVESDGSVLNQSLRFNMAQVIESLNSLR